jgi:hypothetical protein
MRSCHSFSRGDYHLVKRLAVGKVWVKLPAELARPTGARIKSFHDGWINVFHEEAPRDDLRFLAHTTVYGCPVNQARLLKKKFYYREIIRTSPRATHCVRGVNFALASNTTLTIESAFLCELCTQLPDFWHD